MANEIEIKVPDIGGATKVDVIEILVKIGDMISIDTPLITLESDKASMEIPSPSVGKVTQVEVSIGDKVSEGDLILRINAEQDLVVKNDKANSPPPANDIEQPESPSSQQKSRAVTQEQSVQVVIPDIGGATQVDVIDIMVSPGDKIEKEQALLTLEGDKATMDIPSPYAGIIKEVQIKLGAKVSQGSPILIMDILAEQHDEPNALLSIEQHDGQSTEQPVSLSPSAQFIAVSEPPRSSIEEQNTSHIIPAGPAVRRIAHELGIELSAVKGTGRKGRITKDDLHDYVKIRLSAPQSSEMVGLPTIPVVDFTKFGEIELKPLNKIKKATGVNVHRAWITIPHVTQFDEADITELETFRKGEAEHNKTADYKLTILAFVVAVVSRALQHYPQFNASLDATGQNLIYKKYCNLGIAVETPNGLVVPVIKNVNKLSVSDIAKEMARLSSKARDKGLMPADMSGGCFTISSLGGIGGTAFTPIVNSPEVAILGLSRSVIKPVYQNGQFVPRLMLPLSLSYDHRVIDGAEGARFTRYVSECLADIRKIIL